MMRCKKSVQNCSQINVYSLGYFLGLWYFIFLRQSAAASTVARRRSKAAARSSDRLRWEAELDRSPVRRSRTAVATLVGVRPSLPSGSWEPQAAWLRSDAGGMGAWTAPSSRIFSPCMLLGPELPCTMAGCASLPCTDMGHRSSSHRNLHRRT